MIARFRFLLPFRIHIPVGAALSPYSVEFGGYEFLVLPPYQASLAPEKYGALCDPDGLGPITVPVNQVVEGLSPANPPIVDVNVEVSGSPVVAANAVEIRVQQGDFDRRPKGPEGGKGGDLSFSIATEVVNDFLRRFQAISRSSKVHQLSLAKSYKVLEYLDDRGELLPLSTPPLVRWVADVRGNVEMVVLTAKNWDFVTSQAIGYALPVWEALLLDAEASVTEIGPSLVLAVTALETAVDSALEAKSQERGIPADIWAWFMKRRFRIDQKCGDLLQLLVGQSLTADSERNSVLKRVSGARNAFTHGGVAILNGTPVSEDQATQMIAETRGLVAWIVRVCSLPVTPPSETIEIKIKGTLIEVPEALPSTGPVTA